MNCVSIEKVIKILDEFNKRFYHEYGEDIIHNVNNNIIQDGFGSYDVVLITFREQYGNTYDLFVGYSESEDMLLIENDQCISVLEYWQENGWTLEEYNKLKKVIFVEE